MLKEVEFIRELFSDEFAEAEARGEARGEARRARAMLLRLLSQRFGELPDTVVGKIEQQEADWCEEMIVRAASAQSLEELGL